MYYEYIPVYGVEPFQNNTNAPVGAFGGFGGGAEITDQNLLITLWSLANKQHIPPATGQLLQPDYVNVTDGSNNGVLLTHLSQGFSQLVPSRTSCKILIINHAIDPLPLPLLGIMNPPGELKNLYQNYCKAYLSLSLIHI